jgi:hypothetical protein
MKKEIRIPLTTIIALGLPLISGVFYAGAELQDIHNTLKRLETKEDQNSLHLAHTAETLGELGGLVQNHKNTHIRYVHNTKKDVVMETPSGDRIVVPALEVVKL